MEKPAYEAPELTPEDEAQFAAEADFGFAEIEAGEFIENEEIIRWLESWGTDNPLPKPTPKKQP